MLSGAKPRNFSPNTRCSPLAKLPQTLSKSSQSIALNLTKKNERCKEKKILERRGEICLRSSSQKNSKWTSELSKCETKYSPNASIEIMTVQSSRNISRSARLSTTAELMVAWTDLRKNNRKSRSRSSFWWMTSLKDFRNASMRLWMISGAEWATRRKLLRGTKLMQRWHTSLLRKPLRNRVSRRNESSHGYLTLLFNF